MLQKSSLKKRSPVGDRFFYEWDVQAAVSSKMSVEDGFFSLFTPERPPSGAQPIGPDRLQA
jgi:hypothetical protein